MTNVTRLAFLCFLWDVQHAVLFSQSLCMTSFELRSTLPCSGQAWEAESAEDWWSYFEHEPQISYLSVLKAYINPDTAMNIPRLNALSQLLILHGLLSIQWDMKRRDQTTLHLNAPGTSAQLKWQERLAQSYSAWKADFDSYCMDTVMALQEGSVEKIEFARFNMTSTAIYHAAHITLEVEILDLQIYAGARHIIGRPVGRADFDRSRRIVREWAKPGGSSGASKAAWHAAHLIRDGIMNLDAVDFSQPFHYPWCLYLATLTCWAFNFANVMDKDPNALPSHWTHGKRASSTGRNMDRDSLWRAKVEMNALISSMASVMPEHQWRVLGKHTTFGLTTVMTNHLGKVRWAMIHEGIKVLSGLVPERSGSDNPDEWK